MSEELYPLSTAARILHLSENHARTLVRYGFLKPRKRLGQVQYVALSEMEEAEKTGKIIPPGYLNVHDAAEYTHLSSNQLYHSVHEYGLHTRKVLGKTNAINVYKVKDLDRLKETLSKARAADEQISPTQGVQASTEADHKKLQARMRQWIDKQKHDHDERERAEAEKWSLFPLQLAAQKQAIAEGKRRLAEKRKEEAKNDIRATRINILE